MILSVLLASLSASVYAVDAKDRGLFITPIRRYLAVDPGHTLNDKVTVANLTKSPIDVTLSAEQFLVADYTYDYNFTATKEDWVRFSTPSLQLKAGDSKEVSYQVTVPQKAEPGGHYFTVLASANLKQNEQVRAATMLYVTVAGKLIKTSAIVGDAVPWVTFGGEIPFHFNIKNTGNTHFFAYTSGRLEGFTAQAEKNEPAHIILPATTRTLDGVFLPPILPGIYKAIYGYKTDAGVTITQSKYIVYAPLWSIAVLAGLGWFLVIFLGRKKRLFRRHKPPRTY